MSAEGKGGNGAVTSFLCPPSSVSHFYAFLISDTLPLRHTLGASSTPLLPLPLLRLPPAFPWSRGVAAADQGPGWPQRDGWPCRRCWTPRPMWSSRPS